MLRIVLLTLLGVLATGIWHQSYGQEKNIEVRQLPAKAREFLKIHYGKVGVSSVKKEVESWFERVEYSVKLRDGKEIEFDHEGNWKEVDGNRQAIPLSLVPQNILDYIKRSFPKTEITKLKKTAKRYEVAISNGLKIKFTHKGEFIKIDD